MGDFLRGYSGDYIRAASEEDLAFLDEAQRENRWLGTGPASEDAVRAAKERLGVRLPPSYRNFLLVSAGFRMVSTLPEVLQKAHEIRWMPKGDPLLVELWDGEVELTFDDCLLITRPVGHGRRLLDQSAIGLGGEWTAYDWPFNDDDPIPYPSFSALMVNAREEFEAYHAPFFDAR